MTSVYIAYLYKLYISSLPVYISSKHLYMGLLDIFNQNSKVRKSGKNNIIWNTENMLPISEIRGNTIVLKDGGLRSIISVIGVNLDLKSGEEQEMVIEQYKKFLNGLEFPIQIIAHNTYLDLTSYIGYMKTDVDKILQDTLKAYGNEYISFMESINNKDGLIYIKEFYIVVPYYESGEDANQIRKPWWQKFLDMLDPKDSAEKIVERYRGFLKNKKFLETRNALITDGLRSIGMQAKVLENDEIISLLFKFYNPTSHSSQASLASPIS